MTKKSMKIFLIWNNKKQEKFSMGGNRGFFASFEKANYWARVFKVSIPEYEIWEFDLLENTKTVHPFNDKGDK